MLAPKAAAKEMEVHFFISDNVIFCDSSRNFLMEHLLGKPFPFPPDAYECLCNTYTTYPV